MKKIVTDGIYIYAWTRDNLSQTIKKFNEKNKMIIQGSGVCSNGFMQYGLAFNGTGLKLLEQFCNENGVELIKVPALSIDTHKNLKQLLKAAGIN